MRSSSGPSCPDKRAHELAVDQGCNRVDINPLGRQELARVFDGGDARRLDTDVCEPGTCELLYILGFLHGAGNAAHPKFDTMLDLRRDLTRSEERRVGKECRS